MTLTTVDGLNFRSVQVVPKQRPPSVMTLFNMKDETEAQKYKHEREWLINVKTFIRMFQTKTLCCPSVPIFLSP